VNATKLDHAHSYALMLKPMSDPSADLPDVPDDKREAISLWLKERFETIERQAEERAEMLRTVGEHPSPIFQKFVRRFAGLGISKTGIAKLLDMGVGTLMQHYSGEIELGAAETTVAVAGSMLKIATDPDNPSAAKVGMSWLERRGGEEWKPAAKKLEIDDSRNKAPIIDSSKLTYEERSALRLMLTRVANGGEGDPVEEDPIIGESDGA
jgi:hypothetical protein